MTLRTSPLRSTYRLQLQGLGFGGAAALVPYLAELGIDTLYVSPLAAATTGSTHGYDVVDPTRLDPALGTARELEALLAELDRHGMRLLVDIVPNHMATGGDDGWWVDVLRRGPASPYARVFDVDWDGGGGKVVLPVLAVPFGDALEGGDITLELGHRDDAGRTVVVRYGDRTFPVSPETTAAALVLIDEGRPSGGAGDAGGASGWAGRLASLEALLEAQHYRLVFWRVGRHLVNYRRFFDIDGLVGARVEDPDVYALTHRLVFELAADERVAGVRVDHVDGLADPTAYLVRLHADLSSRRRLTAPVLLVEKILAAGECLPAGWPVAGTTGYEFATVAVDLFVDPAGAAAMAPAGASFAALALEGRREALEASFPGQLTRLARAARAQAARSRSGRDLAEYDVRRALAAVTARLGVYRTYLATAPPSEGDRARIEAAFDAAAADAADPAGAFALRELRRLLLDPAGAGDVARCWQQLTSAVAAKGVEDTALYRFAGLLAAADVGSDPSPPPEGAVCRFHAAMIERARLWPGALNATSTHDAKRSEDVRARLAVLSEMAEEWARLTAAWHDRYLTVEGAASASGRTALPRSVTDTVYQAVAGAWPLDCFDEDGFEARVRESACKSAREAKTHTSWTDPDREFERRLESFVTTSLRGGDGSIVAGVEELVARVGPAAAVNSLSLVVLKATAPGVPDVYQGTEVWRPMLVDPDNRRPVDFARLAAALARLPLGADRAAYAGLLAAWRTGAVKLHVLQRVLLARTARPALFAEGEYLPLEVRGSRAGHVVAFTRRCGGDWALAVVPRLVLGLAGPSAMPTGEAVWGDTAVVLPAGSPRSGRDVLTDSVVAAAGGLLELADLLGVFPAAVVLF